MVGVFGAALVAVVGDSCGHRVIAAGLAVPEGTVGGWLRRARSHVGSWRALTMARLAGVLVPAAYR